jgi:hypothetical protein
MSTYRLSLLTVPSFWGLGRGSGDAVGSNRFLVTTSDSSLVLLGVLGAENIADKVGCLVLDSGFAVFCEPKPSLLYILIFNIFRIIMRLFF